MAFLEKLRERKPFLKVLERKPLISLLAETRGAARKAARIKTY